MSRARGLVVVSLALILPTAAAAAPEPPAAVVPRVLEVPAGKLFVPQPVPDLELFATGNVIGYIDTCGCKLNPAGGIARRAFVLDEARKAFPGTPVMLLDTGNFTDVPTAAGDLRTRTLLEAMVKLGTRAAGVGERDLDLGYADFMTKTKGIDIPFLSTNVVTQGTTQPVFPPYTIVEVTGRDGKAIRVGVMSVVRFNPLWQKAGPPGTNLAIASPQAMIERTLPEVRKRSDVVVLLAGLPKADALELAQHLTGVDLMLNAYGDEYSTLEEKSGATPIVRLGNQGKRLSENRVMLERDHRVGEVVTFMHFLTARYPDDPAMKAIVTEVNAKLAPQAAETPKKAEILAPPQSTGPPR